MKRDFLVLSILLLLALVVWQADDVYSAYKARRFWNEFLAVNSAWLTPNPPAMTYKVTYLHRDEFPAALEVWYSPGDNVRNLWSTIGPGDQYQEDERFANGKCMVACKWKHGWTPKLSLKDRITAQTGHPFVTSFHVFAVNGLPSHTVMEDRGKTVILRWHGYREGDTWFPTSEDCDMELVIDRRTKLPIRIKEYEEGLISGRTVHTHFVNWLKLNGKPVPELIHRQVDQGRQEEFRFQVIDGVWIGTEMVSKSQYARGLHTEKALVSNFKIGPIPRSMFVDKGD